MLDSSEKLVERVSRLSAQGENIYPVASVFHRPKGASWALMLPPLLVAQLSVPRGSLWDPTHGERKALGRKQEGVARPEVRYLR